MFDDFSWLVGKLGKMSPNSTWKAIEREICRYLGCERSGPTGKTGADCSCPSAAVSVQVKHRESLPDWFISMVGQARGQAGPSQLPLLVLHPFGWATDDSIAILRLEDMRNLLLTAGLISGIIDKPTKEVSDGTSTGTN